MYEFRSQEGMGANLVAMLGVMIVVSPLVSGYSKKFPDQATGEGEDVRTACSTPKPVNG